MRAFGKDGDMSAFAPKAHLGSAVIDWTPYYSKVAQDTLDGKWQAGTAHRGCLGLRQHGLAAT